MTDDRELLARTWEEVCRSANLDGDCPSALRELLEAYEQPNRHYHNTHHIADSLRELEAVRDQCNDITAVQAAILFHDVIYDPDRADNEALSADVARHVLGKLGAAPALIEKVCDMILATRHSEVPDSEDARLIVDIDLSPLGKPEAEFDANGRAIRQEYANIDDATYRAGRAEMLRRFLNRPQLYFTDTFRSRYEEPARRNLERCIVGFER